MNDKSTSGKFARTLLLVDDDPLVLRFVADVLARDYKLLTAASGSEALVIAGAHAGTISLLLSDFQMPGMTGMELATRLCADTPDMKVLLMSGFDGGMLILNEGWHFLAKPFIASQLRGIVRTLLNEVAPFTAETSK